MTTPTYPLTEQPDLGSRYCPECRRRVAVVDEFADSVFELGREHEVFVRVLECGHDTDKRSGMSWPLVLGGAR